MYSIITSKGKSKDFIPMMKNKISSINNSSTMVGIKKKMVSILVYVYTYIIIN